MTKSTSVSLIVSTYNWCEALSLCLASIKAQIVLPDEVIIADDGSQKETRQLIEKIAMTFPVPLIHIWQPDDGFQLSKIRNKAIAKSSKDYIIQIDGDLILHPQFVSDHIEFSLPDTFATGSRLLMDENLSQNVLKDQRIKIGIFSKGISNFINGVRSRALRRLFGNGYKSGDIYYMRGCNMAFWRSDLIKVNGYNEDFVGWGREDNEIAIRLINSGVRKRSIKFGAIAFHIYHNESTRHSLQENEELLLLAIESKTSNCLKGIDQYLNFSDVSQYR